MDTTVATRAVLGSVYVNGLAVRRNRRDAPAIRPAGVARAVVFGVAVAFAGVTGAIAVTHPAAMDFIAHYAAARLVLTGHGADILDPAAGLEAERAAAPEREQLLPLLQVPAVALIRAPIALLPFGVAFVVMAALDVVTIAVSLTLLARRFGAALPVVAVLLVAPPSALTVAHGQTSAIALLLASIALTAGPRSGGLALGLMLLRIQSAPLLVLAGLLDPARRLWTVAGVLLVVAASAVVVGVDGLVRYAAELLAGTDFLRSGAYGMRAAIGWSGLALGLGLPSLGVLAAVIGVAAGAVAVFRAHPDDRVVVAGAWSLLVAPNLYVHDALLAYPAILLLATRTVPWDAASVLVWLVHLLVAPLGVVWSAAVAIAAMRRVRPAR